MFLDFKNGLNIEFIHRIKELDGYDEFNFYYMINAYFNVVSNNVELFDFCVYEVAESWCVGFWISGNYLLICKNLTQVDIDIISKKIDFSQFIDGFHFAGNTEVINQLVENSSNFSLEPFKERYFYKLRSLKLISKFSNEVCLVTKNDIQDIATLYQKFFHEEYNGRNDKDLHFTIKIVENLLSQKMIYKLKIKDKILGFCTMMSFLNKVPNMIGTIYIDINYRMNDNGKHLLSDVVNRILKEHNEVLLMTTKDSVASNKMVESVRFKKEYDYSDRLIKKFK